MLIWCHLLQKWKILGLFRGKARLENRLTVTTNVVYAVQVFFRRWKSQHLVPCSLRFLSCRGSSWLTLLQPHLSCSIEGQFGKASKPVMRTGRGQEGKPPHSWCHQPTVSWLWSPPWPGKFNDRLWCIFNRWWSPSHLYGVSSAALGVQRFHSLQKTS